MASESSAVIQFIADNQRRPVDRGIFSRKIHTPAIPVLLPTVGSPWKARLTFGGALLLAGLAGGLFAGQTDPGRALLATITSPHADLAPAEPAPPPAPAPAPVAAALPCPTPAPIAVAAPAPTPPPAPVAAPAEALAVATPAPPPAAPEPAAAIPRPRPRREGTLHLSSRPTCDILVDGKKTGLHTPQRSLELKPGKHTITLVNKKSRIKTRFSVRIAAGKTTRVSKDLRRKKR